MTSSGHHGGINSVPLNNGSMYTRAHRNLGHQIRQFVEYNSSTPTEPSTSAVFYRAHGNGEETLKPPKTHCGTCRWVGCRLDQFNVIGSFRLDPPLMLYFDLHSFGLPVDHPCADCSVSIHFQICTWTWAPSFHSGSGPPFFLTRSLAIIRYVRP